MSLLHVVYDNKTILAMRPENPDKSFHSDDVPNGTESVIYKAAKLIGLDCPKFTDEEKQTKINELKDSFSLEFDGDDLTPSIVYDSNLSMLDQTVIKLPSDLTVYEQIDKERGFTKFDIFNKQQEYGLQNFAEEGNPPIYEKYSEEDPEFDIGNTLDKNWKYILTRSEAGNLLRKKDNNGNIIPDLSFQEAYDLSIDNQKTILAQYQLGYLIRECCIVPSLSEIIISSSGTVSGTTFTDMSADFISEGVDENDLIKIDGELLKVDSVTDANNIVLKNAPLTDIIESTTYTILRSSFMSQFDYIKTN